MTFSTATLSDIPLIQALAEEIWWPTYGPIQPKDKVEYLLKTFYSQEAMAASMKSGQQEFVLLYDDAVAWGFASFGRSESKENTWKLYKLYVLPSTHGKGYGRAFVEEIKRRVKFRSTDAAHLELNVYRGNPALKFYEKIGFKIIAEVDEPVGAYFFEDYIMSIKI